MKLSIIIPIRNEEHGVKKIVNQLQNELKSLSYEIIFINDFSTDNTAVVTEEIIKNSSFLTGIIIESFIILVLFSLY